jgi:hypothetical protein
MQEQNVLDEKKMTLSQRFIKAVDYLQSAGFVKSDTEFARSIGVAQTVISGVRNASGRNVSVKMIENTCKKYSFISSEWLITGMGQMQKQDDLNLSDYVNYNQGGLDVGLLIDQIKEKDNQIKALTRALNMISEKLGKLKVTEYPAAVKALIEYLPIQLPMQQKREEIAA